MKKRNSTRALVRGMRVLVAVQLMPKTWTMSVNGSAPVVTAPTVVPLRLVHKRLEGWPHTEWAAANKQGIVLADISPEDEGITWVRGWTKTSERARALQAAVALS